MKNSIRTVLWLLSSFSLPSTIKVLRYYIKKKEKTLEGKEYLVRFRYKGRTVRAMLRENDDDFAILRGIFLNECYKTNKKADVIFDCGAHLGFASIYYQVFNPQAKIYCFEPDEDTFRLLKLNMALSNINARVFDIAVSDKNTISSFEENKDKPSNSMLSRKKAKEGSEEEEKKETKVIVRRLDTICKFLDIKRISLLKLDIEGHEIKALNSLGKIKVEEAICENDSYIYQGALKEKIKKMFKIKKPNPMWLKLYGKDDCLIAGQEK